MNPELGGQLDFRTDYPESTSVQPDYEDLFPLPYQKSRRCIALHALWFGDAGQGGIQTWDDEIHHGSAPF
jgi:hypothetical protein